MSRGFNQDVEGDEDLGTETDITTGLSKEEDHDEECGPPTERDMIDDALEDVIAMLVHDGYDDNDAEDAVYSAMEQLIDNGHALDTPDIDVPETEKAAWIFNNIPRLKQKLREMGLEFDEEC